MSQEFTGERVIPGSVDINLWNEHFARYALASRLSRGRRVLDLGCGTGYGTAQLALTAQTATGLDISADAIAYARNSYPASNLRWLQSSCTQLPFRDGTIDLAVAFEVIEHLEDWPALLHEVRRILAPGGQFVVSTPNRTYYAETRRLSGPNPFHAHEFEFTEFRDALTAVFPHVSLFLEDHTEGILFRSVAARSTADVRIDGREEPPEHSNFFIAVCAMTPQTGAPTFVYLPKTANLLKERGEHIHRLETELETKNSWLDQSHRDHQSLVELFRKQTTELEERNAWAEKLNEKIVAAGRRIEQLQNEVTAEHAAAQQVVEAYTQKVADLERDVAERTRWALETEERLTGEIHAKCEELAQCVAFLDQAERTVEERTNWARTLDQECQQLRAKIEIVEASRWIRLGRTFGVGPEIRNTK
jgi:SAM-dependent methyltransferase